MDTRAAKASPHPVRMRFPSSIGSPHSSTRRIRHTPDTPGWLRPPAHPGRLARANCKRDPGRRQRGSYAKIGPTGPDFSLQTRADGDQLSAIRTPQDCPSITPESLGEGGAGQELELRLQANDAAGEVLDPRLLALHRLGLALHRVLELDDGGEGAPHPVGGALQAGFRPVGFCGLASSAARRRLLSSMKARASSIAATARSAAAPAASASVASSSLASPDSYAKAPRRISSEMG